MTLPHYQRQKCQSSPFSILFTFSVTLGDMGSWECRGWGGSFCLPLSNRVIKWTYCKPLSPSILPQSISSRLPLKEMSSLQFPSILIGLSCHFSAVEGFRCSFPLSGSEQESSAAHTEGCLLVEKTRKEEGALMKSTTAAGS